MAASQLSCHRSHCDHHSTRESRHNCLLSQITAHRNCVSIHNFSQRGITTRIETPIMSRNVPNSCANLKSRIVPPVTFSSILPPSSEAYQALPCSPLDRRQRTPEGETYPASPLSSSKPPGSSQLSSPFSRQPGRKSSKYKVQLPPFKTTHLFEFFLGPRCERMRRGGQVVLISSAPLQTSFPPAASLKVLDSKSEKEG